GSPAGGGKGGARALRLFPAFSPVCAARRLQPPGILQRAPEDELHLSVDAAQVIRSPALDSLPESRVDAQRVLFAFRHISHRGRPGKRAGRPPFPTGTASPCSARAGRRTRRTAPP